MTASIVGEAAIMLREFSDLIFPVFHSVNLAVNEDQVPASAMLLVVKIASVGIDLRHGSSPVACHDRTQVRLRSSITSQFR